MRQWRPNGKPLGDAPSKGGCSAGGGGAARAAYLSPCLDHAARSDDAITLADEGGGRVVVLVGGVGRFVRAGLPTWGPDGVQTAHVL